MNTENTEIISVHSSPAVTIKSSPSESKAQKEEKPISFVAKGNEASTASSERVPVSWSSRPNRYQVHPTAESQNCNSPSPKTKVMSWLNRKNNWSQVSVVNAPPRFVNENRNKSVILSRLDFSKSSYTISSCKTQETSPLSAAKSEDSAVNFEKHKVFHITTNNTNPVSRKSGYEIDNSTPSISKRAVNEISSGLARGYNIFIKKEAVEEGDDEDSLPLVKSDNAGKKGLLVGINMNTPLSPESQKKELYSYLQLVNLNAPNNKEIASIQNRRSVRVKNNLLLTGKRELERKLNGETSKTEEVTSDDATKKSFKELFGDRNPLEQRQSESVDEPASHNAIAACIPKSLLEKREDFDDFAEEYFSREQIKIPKQKKPKHFKKTKYKNRLVSKWETPQNVETLKKRRIREQFNRIFKKSVKKNGVYKLKRKKYKRERDKSQEQKRCTVRKLLARRVTRSLSNLLEDGRHNKKINPPKKKKKKRSKIVEPAIKEDEEEEEETAFADVIMQDHDYICDEKSESSTSPCHGFSPPEPSNKQEEVRRLCTQLNDYLESVSETAIVQIETSTSPIQIKADVIDPSLISPRECEYIALDPEIKPVSLHRNLVQQKARRRRLINPDYETDESPNWDTDESPGGSRHYKNDKRSNLSHSIRISREAGAVVNAFYVNFNLIVAQEFEVTFWSQSALGNVLGAHNMWLPKGQVSRLVLDNCCVQKDSREMVISLENSAAYVELWTKEHKSDKREIPVADVFAAVYFCRARQNGVFKKVLQLENIKSLAEDVRYIVMLNSRNVVVSWRVLQGEEKKTIIHCYHLAADYQTVDVIKEVQSIDHYVSSLHNIEGCADLVLGWGANKVTVWNLEYGYVTATVEILESVPLNSPLSVKCDRGFLFLLQQMQNGNLCLIAINNGMKQSWKRLQTFVAPKQFENLTGVYLENGLLVAFYRNGVLSWHINSGELRVEEGLSCDVCIPSGNHVIMFANQEVYVRHALALLIATDDCLGTIDDI